MLVIPTEVRLQEHAIYGKQPVIWWGQVARDGDASPWKDVPIGSIYLANVSGTLTVWIKDADNQADADWGTVDITT